MAGTPSQRAAALLAITASLAVLCAGCLQQDRPQEESFFVVADAGSSLVVTAGDTAHFAWAEDHAIEADGAAAVHEEVEYEWATSTQQHGNQSEFNLSTSAETLLLVGLNVTAKNHTASDAAAVLVLPPGAPLGGRLYLASLGDIRVQAESGSGVIDQPADVGTFHAEKSDYDLAGVQYHRFLITFPDVVLEAQGTLLFAVKSPSNATRTHVSPPLAFDAAKNYTLVIDTSPVQAHRMETRNEAGTLENNSSLADFESVNAAEREAKVLVSPAGAKLPGFEGAAVASAVVLASAVALRRRR